MDPEQSPQKPNFGKVVSYAAVALIVIFLIAYFTLRKNHSVPGHYSKYPTSELWLTQPGRRPSC